MRRGKFLIFIAIVMLLFLQCHKCHDEQLTTITFSQNDLNINPYMEGSNIKFISSSNDTLKYLISRQMIQSAYFENNGTDYFALHGCKGRWYYYENNRTQLSDPENSWIGINLTFPTSYTRPTEKLIGFFLNFTDTTIAEFNVPLKFDDGIIMNLDSYDPSYSQYLESFLDSVNIGQKVYHNVYKIVSEPDYQGKYTNWVNKFYYSTLEGVVGFTLKNNKYYYLLK